jgi:hypothetical protein
VLADHRQQVPEQLALARGEIAGDRVEGRRVGNPVLDPDPDPPRLVVAGIDRGAGGVGRLALQGSALRLCRYLRPS